MPDSINFVRERRRRLTKVEVTDRLMMRWSVIGLGAVFAVFLVVMGAQLVVRYQVSQAKKQQATLEKTVLSKEEIEKSYVLFANKLKALGEIFQTRTNKQQAISFFTSLFGEQVLIREINYAADEGILSFNVNAPSVFVLEQVFNQLGANQVRSQYATLNKSELRRQNDGKYEMTVTVELAAKPSPSPKPAAAGSPGASPKAN